MTRPARALALLMPLVFASGADAAGSRPDVVISNLRLSQATAAPGARLLVSFDVVNRGTRAANRFSTSVILTGARQFGLAELRVDRRVPAKAKRSFSVPVRIPARAAAGKRAIVVWVDARSELREADENNNLAEQPLALNPKYLPDLGITSLKLSRTQGRLRGEITATATVDNRSEHAVYGPFRIAFYCSKDAAITSTDRLLGVRQMLRVEGRSSATLETQLKMDTGCGVSADDRTWVGAIVDPLGGIKEHDRSDNSRSVAYSVQRAPDLVPRVLKLSRRDAAPGDRVEVSYRVFNDGTTAERFESGVVLGATAQLKGTALDSTSVYGVSADRWTGTLHHTVTIPKNAPSGPMFLGVRLDQKRQIGELDEDNNVAARRFTIRRVDLTEGYFKAKPARGAAGSDVKLIVSFRNTGRDRVPAGTARLFFSMNGRIEPAKDLRLRDIETPALRPGARSKERRIEVRIPASAKPGYRYFGLVIDPDNSIAEINESNNGAITPIRVTR